MLIVCAEQARVEAELVGGLLACPSCRRGVGAVGACAGAGAALPVGDRWLRPRRARCRGCAGTHVLLPDVALLRRRDEVAVIGAAIEANVAGRGVSADRGAVGGAGGHGAWLAARGSRERAELIRAHFTRWAVALDPELGPVLPAGERRRGRGRGDRGRGAGVGAAVRAG